MSYSTVFIHPKGRRAMHVPISVGSSRGESANSPTRVKSNPWCTSSPRQVRINVRHLDITHPERETREKYCLLCCILMWCCTLNEHLLTRDSAAWVIQSTCVSIVNTWIYFICYCESDVKRQSFSLLLSQNQNGFLFWHQNKAYIPILYTIN